MVAVTPRLALLIASRIPCIDLLLLAMTTLPLAWLPSCVKVGFCGDAVAAVTYFPLDSVPPLMAPNWNNSVVGCPSPIGAVMLVWPAVASVCACANLVTLTAYVPGTALLFAVPEITELSAALAVML